MEKIELIWDFRVAVMPDGRQVQLDLAEAKVLQCLLRSKGVTPKEKIIKIVFGGEVSASAVSVYITRLREKIGAARIITVAGVGYRMAR